MLQLTMPQAVMLGYRLYIELLATHDTPVYRIALTDCEVSTAVGGVAKVTIPTLKADIDFTLVGVRMVAEVDGRFEPCLQFKMGFPTTGVYKGGNLDIESLTISTI